MESGRLRIQFQRFGANFAHRWPRWTGARLIEVHLHSKSFGGTLKWPLKGGSRLIEVIATAGLTVVSESAQAAGTSIILCVCSFLEHSSDPSMKSTCAEPQTLLVLTTDVISEGSGEHVRLHNLVRVSLTNEV